ncbi:MAG: SpoVR family protein [Gemmataceae bacterium]
MGIPYDTRLPPDLLAHKLEIEKHARAYGLDFYETIFEVVDAEDLNEIAAYGGFPTRYPHWSYGMAFEELKKGYDYGLSKIYEMVINNDPCYAYLMRCNHTVDQKLVMAHVYGHCLAPETMIETIDGPRPIVSIRVGDLVLTHTGAFKKVRAVARRRFAGEILHIGIARSGERVRITGEHPVGVACRGYELEWMPAAELLSGMSVAFPRSHESAKVRGPVVETEEGHLMGLKEPHTTWSDRYEWNLISSPKKEPYEGYVYNFSVEEDESYTLSAGMVVHNCDFFKNNAFFAHTSRKMMDEMANHGVRVRAYSERFGEDEVEAFVDRCMSIDDLIDIHSTAIKRREDSARYDFKEKEEEGLKLTRFKSKDYMSDYINPPDVLKAEEEERKKEMAAIERTFPERPEKDVLLFLMEHAPLKPWQRDVLSIIRDEAYYFAPQGQTKIMNEGWASYWHSTIMTERALEPWECVDYADHHSGTMATSRGRVNPYKLGIELFRDIERRWNTGQFGKEWEECEDLDKKRAWDKKLGLGRKKIFEVRKVHNDITFIDSFLTPEFCQQHQMFSYAYNEQGGNYVIESREFQKIKQRLLFSLTNAGRPFIYVVDGNYKNRGELLLRHEHNGLDLKLDRAADTLANVQAIWSRPVHLQTIIENQPSLMTFDGNNHSIKNLGEADDARKQTSGKAR